MNPLQPHSKLVSFPLYAVDGEIGSLEALYFDDVNWMVRYLLVDTGDWLAHRRVLVSPVAVGEVDEDEHRVFIELTRRQIENSPPLDAGQAVSRIYESAYYRYYGWPAYWEDDRRCRLPLSLASREAKRSAGTESRSGHREARVQRTTVLDGCVIVSRDGAVGQVRALIVDIRYWLIRYLVTETRTGQPGRIVLLSPCWIERVSWGDHLMNTGLASTTVDSAPGYDSGAGISRDYEVRLFRHFGRRGYWQRNNGMN